nr:hypothetical protein BaRGS_028822 [Batillaria attramentaria]
MTDDMSADKNHDDKRNAEGHFDLSEHNDGLEPEGVLEVNDDDEVKFKVSPPAMSEGVPGDKDDDDDVKVQVTTAVRSEGVPAVRDNDEVKVVEIAAVESVAEKNFWRTDELIESLRGGDERVTVVMHDILLGHDLSEALLLGETEFMQESVYNEDKHPEGESDRGVIPVDEISFVEKNAEDNGLRENASLEYDEDPVSIITEDDSTDTQTATHETLSDSYLKEDVVNEHVDVVQRYSNDQTVDKTTDQDETVVTAKVDRKDSDTESEAEAVSGRRNSYGAQAEDRKDRADDKLGALLTNMIGVECRRDASEKSAVFEITYFVGR